MSATREEADDATGEYLPARPRVPRVVTHIGAESHPGKVRANNEDHYLVAKLAKSMRVCRTNLPQDWATRYSDEEGYLLVVADGMGGAAAGQVASKMAVEEIESFTLNVVKWFLHLKGDEAALLAELRQAFERADASIIERAASNPSLRGMGTTLTMAFSVGTEVFFVHAGDSRGYLFRKGELTRVTTDHTLVQILIDGGALTPEAARHHARRNVVTNVVGGPHSGVHTQVHKITIESGDVILLCSDGLTEPVEEAQIAEILAYYADPDEAARRLIEAALGGGGPDNITVVVARYEVK